MQRILAPALVGLVVLAGCAAIGDPVASPSLPGAPTPTLPAWNTTKVGTGADAETSLWVSPDGQTILGCAHGGFTRPSPMWASVDGGATFTAMDPQPNPIVSGDCDVTVTDNGDWFIIYDTIASATVAASSDKGKTWRLHYFVSPPFGGVDRPWIAAAGNQVYVIWASVMAAEPFVAAFTKSSDGGRTWSPAVVMDRAASEAESNCFLGHHIVKDAGRTIQVPINCWPGMTNQGNTFPSVLNLLTSRDAGATWTRSKVLGPHTTSYRIPTAAYAGDGSLWLAYPEGNPPKEVRVVRSVDEGKTWGEPTVVIDNLTVDLPWIWIDGRADGSATLAWFSNAKPEGATGTAEWWQVWSARVRDENGTKVEWVSQVMQPYSGPGQTLEFLMVRHDAEGNPHVLYPMGGPGCAKPPQGMERMNRNNQCVFLAVVES